MDKDFSILLVLVVKVWVNLHHFIKCPHFPQSTLPLWALAAEWVQNQGYPNLQSLKKTPHPWWWEMQWDVSPAENQIIAHKWEGTGWWSCTVRSGTERDLPDHVPACGRGTWACQAGRALLSHELITPNSSSTPREGMGQVAAKQQPLCSYFCWSLVELLGEGVARSLSAT